MILKEHEEFRRQVEELQLKGLIKLIPFSPYAVLALLISRKMVVGGCAWTVGLSIKWFHIIFYTIAKLFSGSTEWSYDIQ